MRTRHILYLTAIEDVAESPLIRSQVVPVLRDIAARDPDHRLGLVALYPLVNWWRHRRSLRGLRTELAAAGIALHLLPLLFLTRYFYIPRRLLVLYRAQAFLAGLWIALRWRPALLHSRSYPATLAATWIKRITGAPVLFDTRGLYPEEGVTLKAGGKTAVLDESSYGAWKDLERRLLHGADAVTVVSQPSLDILGEQYPALAARISVIPPCTHVPSVEERDEWRLETRRELDLPEDCVVVAYAGSWFEPGAAAALFKSLVEALPGARWHFLLLLAGVAADDPQTTGRLAEALGPRLAGRAAFTAFSAPQSRVLRYLAGADLAVLPLEPAARWSADPRYLHLADTRISVKFTEYLACGLPTFVSRWLGAAAGIVQQADLGLVYNQPGAGDPAQWLARWQSQRTAYRQRAWQYACDHFDVERVAAGYFGLYQQLLSGGGGR